MTAVGGVKYGLAMSNRRVPERAPKRARGKTREMVARRLDKDQSIPTIAKAVGVSRAAVYWHIKQIENGR